MLVNTCYALGYRLACFSGDGCLLVDSEFKFIGLFGVLLAQHCIGSLVGSLLL